MAKILKIEPPKNLVVKHSECGATIEFDRKEVEEKYYRDYGGGGDTYYIAICPHCGIEFSWLK